ncbi:serine hydrolase [Parasphingopyxis sp.]|uniref:serine hydrolase domain-containing protein n=1 Tax=Parasphingopyxis sp. TaxID=1920299 RepID=UPI002638D6D1|nr:serine hydrolase domain-containing protein [Parasphingopyxis sp.]
MNRLALPLTLLFVALGVLAMAPVLSGPFPSQAVSEGLSITLDAADPEAAEPSGEIIAIDPRSGLIDYNEIDRRIGALMEDETMVGLAVAVMENGEITFARGYGETVHESGDAVTVDTAFRWASLSKGVAATMIALLERDGALRLDAPVSRFAPSLRLPGSSQMQVTVADLLSHRLGIERNALDNRLEADEDPYTLRSQLAGHRVACPPGTCFRYQNVGFDASSEIVEGITGQSYEAAVQRRLFQPLGMQTATISRQGLFDSPSWALSHRATGEEVPVVEPYYRVPAAGGVNGSIRDLALWMQAQVNGAPDIIPPAVLATVHTPVVRTEREDRRNSRYAERISNTRYALGWRVYDYVGHTVITHRGAVRGYRAMIMIDPALRSGVAILWNSGTGRPFGIPMDIFDQLYGLPDANWIDPDGASRDADTLDSARSAGAR